MLPSFSKRLLVVGDIMLDQYTDTVVHRISPEAPVPIASVRSRWSVPGGAANVARNVSSLGCAVTVLGVRAKDAKGDELQELLERYGIIAPTVLVADRPTTTKSRILAQGQQLLRLDEEVTSEIPEGAVSRIIASATHTLPWAEAVILSDYGKGVLTAQREGMCLAAHLISAAREKGVPVLVDPKGVDWSLYAGADCLTPNTREIATLLRVDEEDFDGILREAFALMDALSLSHLLITRGPKGMALLSHGQSQCIETRALEVSDVSGAGDTVIAVLSACIAEGIPWDQAAAIANRAAGIVVGRVGTSAVDREELLSALAHDTSTFSLALNSVSAKIMTRERLLDAVAQWRREKASIVFTNGCFDLIHPGHVRLLQEAAGLGDKLIVALNADVSVRRLKGEGRPVQTENARAVVMASMEGVDAVVLFDEDTPQSLIELVSPDVLVKGGDYTLATVVGADYVQSHGGRVHLVDTVEGFSTSKIVAALGDR